MEKRAWNKLSELHTNAIAVWYDLGRLIAASNEKEETDTLLEAKASFNTGMELMEKVLYGEGEEGERGASKASKKRWGK